MSVDGRRGQEPGHLKRGMHSEGIIRSALFGRRKCLDVLHTRKGNPRESHRSEIREVPRFFLIKRIFF